MKIPPKKRIIQLIALAVGVIIILNKCSFHSLPDQRYYSFKIDYEEGYDDGRFFINVKNTQHCPMRLYITGKGIDLSQANLPPNPIILSPRSDTTLYIQDQGDLSGQIAINMKYGDPDAEIIAAPLQSLPFRKGDKYKILQGINSYPTHNTRLSRYALDFTMSEGDTVACAHDGYVVGVIDGYDGWGVSDKWKNYGNQILIYHPDTRLYTLYGHLKHEGALVKNGDYVRAGQAIALSGQTGQASDPHLHFNTMRPDEKGGNLRSYLVDSIGDYAVRELKRSTRVTH